MVNKILKTTLLKTFTSGKQKGSLTGEASRQREILKYLADPDNLDSYKRTRTGIARYLTKAKFTDKWTNIYSGVFRDLNEYLIPIDLIKVEGRVTPNRGPELYRVEGIPYYGLTKNGQDILMMLLELEQLDKQFKLLSDKIENRLYRTKDRYEL